jgi:hypothetical protein
MIIDLKTAVEFLENNDDFLILTHSHPDGDTLGCGFALCEALQLIGKNAVVRCNDSVPAKYSYMGSVCEDDIEYENIIAVDVADAKLLGRDFEARFGGRVKLCIDHHGSNRLYAERTLLDPSAAAACEIVLEVIRGLGAIPAITQEMRSAPIAIAPPTMGPKANAPMNIGRHSTVRRRALSLNMYFASVAKITLAAVSRPDAVITFAEYRPLFISLFFKIKNLPLHSRSTGRNKLPCVPAGCELRIATLCFRPMGNSPSRRHLTPEILL